MFPFVSVPVNVTVFAPIFAQVKSVLSILNIILQLSLLPLSILEGTIVAEPVSSKSIVKFCAMTVGAVLSTTVTRAVALDVLPLTSVPINVTVLSPKLAQVKLP